MDSETDPLAITLSDNLALFGENVEFIVETDVEDVGTTSNTVVVQIQGLDQSRLPVPALPNKDNEVIDLRSPSPIQLQDEDFKDELEIKDEELDITPPSTNIQVKPTATYGSTKKTESHAVGFKQTGTNLLLTALKRNSIRDGSSFIHDGNLKITKTQSFQPYCKSKRPPKPPPRPPNKLTSKETSTISAGKTAHIDKNNSQGTLIDAPNIKKSAKVNYPCYVPDCTTDAESCKRKENRIHLFRAPVDENRRKIWDVAIGRADKRLEPKDSICEKHFLNDDLIHQVIVTGQDGDIMVPYPKPKLQQGAVPCIRFSEECCVPNCGNKDGTMYCFPILRNSMYRLWLYMIRNPALKNLTLKDILSHRVCERHFEPDCFDANKGLNNIASPTLYIPDHSSTCDNIVEPTPEKYITPVNTSRICAYKDCMNKSGSDKCLFMFPSDPDRCKAWVKACCLEDIISESTDVNIYSKCVICQDHFDDDQFEIALEKLRPDAIPRTYVHLPNHDLRTSKAFSAPSEVITKKPASASLSRVINSSPKNTVGAPLAKTTNVDPKPTVCAYLGCKNTALDGQMHSFPKNLEKCNAWIAGCGYFISEAARKLFMQTGKICHKHFNMFQTKGFPKVEETAVPVASQSFETPTDIATTEVITESITVNSDEEEHNKIQCAVTDCSNFCYSHQVKRRFHAFPNPNKDPERFGIWVKLLDSKKIENLDRIKIYSKFVVCAKHFEYHFFQNPAKSGALSTQAIPTLHLKADIQWFFTSSYYKTRLQTYFKSLAVTDFSNQDDFIEWKEGEVEKTGETADATKCVLEKDGIRFPGMGCHLQMTKRYMRNKRKYPYGVYRFNKNGYSVANDVVTGECVKIHTAIIIDDDDECEKMVLEQLLEKRTKISEDFL